MGTGTFCGGPVPARVAHLDTTLSKHTLADHFRTGQITPVQVA